MTGKAVQMLKEALLTTPADETKVEQTSVQIEEEMIAIFRGQNEQYKGKLKSLVFNLKKNESLRRDVISGEIAAKKLCVMSPQDLASDEMKKQREILKKEHAQDTTHTPMARTTSQLFKCGKCGKRETTFFQLQTRGGDEPMTTFIECVNCGSRWKQ